MPEIMPSIMPSIVKEDLAEILGADLPWRELAGKTILVSGANGFLPAYLVEALLALNDRSSGKAQPLRVVGLVRNAEKARKRFAHHVGRDDLLLVVQDVCDEIRVEGPVDYVVHAASQASPKHYGTDPAGTFSANVFGTRNLLALALEKQARQFLFFSSSEVYGALAPDKIPTPESVFGAIDPNLVRSCYAEGKRAGETLCAAWSHQFGVRYRIVRPFHTYGPGMALDDGRVFSDFVADIVAGRDIVMKSEGTAVRAYCYLSDAIRGFLTVMLAGKDGEAYNVGNGGAQASVRELAERLVALFPEKGLRVVRDASAAAPGYIASTVSRNAPDTSKLEALGWKPRHSIESGFRRTILSFRSQS